MNTRYILFSRVLLPVIIIAVLTGIVFQPHFHAYAATTLTVTPITWNIISLYWLVLNEAPPR